MKVTIMDGEEAVTSTSQGVIQPSRLTSASQSDVDRRDLLKHYANDSYLAEIACATESGKDAESIDSTEVLDDALQRLAMTEFDRLSLLSYSSARAGTVHAHDDQYPASDSPLLWKGYGETVYFDPLNAHAMKLCTPENIEPVHVPKSACKTQKVWKHASAGHTNKSAISRKSTSRGSKDTWPATKGSLGSLRIGSKKRCGKRAGSYFFPVEKRVEKICKGISEKALSENVKSQMKVQSMESNPVEILHISGCGESVPQKITHNPRKDYRLPRLNKQFSENFCTSESEVSPRDITLSEQENVEPSEIKTGQVGTKENCMTANNLKVKSSAVAKDSAAWKSPKCVLIIPFASQEVESDDENEDVVPVESSTAVNLENISILSYDDKSLVNGENDTSHKVESKQNENHIKSRNNNETKRDDKAKITSDNTSTQHNHNISTHHNQNWIVSLYQKHLQEVGFRLPREKVNSASLRSNLKTMSPTKGLEDASDKEMSAASVNKTVPKLAYTKRVRRQAGHVYSTDNSIDEPLNESTVVVGTNKATVKESDTNHDQESTMMDRIQGEENVTDPNQKANIGGENVESSEEIQQSTNLQSISTIQQPASILKHNKAFLSYNAYRAHLINAGLNAHVVKEHSKNMAAQKQEKSNQSKGNNVTSSSVRKAPAPAGISLRSHRYGWPARPRINSSRSSITAHTSAAQVKSSKGASKGNFLGSAKSTRSNERLPNNSNYSNPVQQLLPIIGKKLHSRSKSTIN